MNVLIVDDDVQVCRTLYTVLSRHHNTSVLSNGHNAVSLLADPSHGFDLVMIDMNMPRLSGKDVIQVLQDIVNVNFVIITGDPNVPQILRKYDILQKPFDMNKLLEWLDSFEKRQDKPRKVCPKSKPQPVNQKPCPATLPVAKQPAIAMAF